MQRTGLDVREMINDRRRGGGIEGINCEGDGNRQPKSLKEERSRMCSRNREEGQHGQNAESKREGDQLRPEQQASTSPGGAWGPWEVS